MSREIKFRAWHKEKKQMIDGSLLFWFKAVAESGKGESVFNACEWMQYAGLTDKNGKEIYEGDILKQMISPIISKNEEDFLIFGEKKADIRQVIYESPCFILTKGIHYSNWITRDFEIIGNIYETPELLEPPLGNNAEPIRNISEDDWRKDDR